MDKYIEMIQSAVDKVNRSYIEVDPKKDRNFVYYERIFCYELYHQMRCLQTQHSDLFEFKIHGELTKDRYEGFGKVTPDFLIHIPNEVGKEKNRVIVEVKTSKNNADEIFKDFEKLNKFIKMDNGYQYGVFIWVGEKLSDLHEEIKKRKRLGSIDKIWVIHKNPNADEKV